MWSISIFFAALIGSPYVDPSVENDVVLIKGSEYKCEKARQDFVCKEYNRYQEGFSIARMFNPGQQMINDDKVNQYYPYPESSFCWVNAIESGNVQNLSTYPWLFLYLPLLVIVIFSFYTLWIAYFRMSQGVSMSLLHRLNILVLNYVNIFWFSCYWFILYVILSIASAKIVYFGNNSEPDKDDLGGNVFLLSLIFYFISSKGAVGVIIWILVGDLKRSLKSQDEDYLDINSAIRGEILNYVITGIRATCQNDISQRKVRIVLTSKLDIENVFKDEKWFLLRIVFGHDELIRSIKRQVRAAPNAEQVSESYRKGVPLSIAGVTSRNLRHRNSLSMIADKIAKLESDNSDGGSIMVSTFVKPSWLKKFWNYFSKLIPPPVFEEFEPNLFSRIRTLYGIDVDSWRRAFKNLSGRLTQDGGASGALFFLTEDQQFVVKSCTEKERDHLIEKASDYYDHLQKEQNSFIAKVFGVFTLTMYSLQFSFFVMQNIVPSGVQEKYDVKGSWVDRETSYPHDGKQVTCQNCFESFIFRKNRTGLSRRHASLNSVNAVRITTDSLSSIRAQDRQRCSKGLKGLHEPLQTKKDLDLKYKIRLDNDEARNLFRQLQSDANFLCDVMGVMDYSLLIGIKKTDISTNTIEDLGQSFWDRFSVKEDFYPPKEEDHFKSYEASVINANYLYYFGIIDFLEVYDYRKKLEHYFKTIILQKDSDGVSCVRAEFYRDRFIHQMADLLDVREEVECRV